MGKIQEIIEIKDLKALKLETESETTESNTSENPVDTANSSSGVRMDQSLNVDVSNNNFTNAFPRHFKMQFLKQRFFLQY